jgi:hypothetical protein
VSHQSPILSQPVVSPRVFLGDKWPAIDFYVELTAIKNQRPYFFVQTKSTAVPIRPQAKRLQISTKKSDVPRLLGIPGPTYIFGVHEPTQRVFVRSVHAGLKTSSITSIPLSHELNSANLVALQNEVRDFWQSTAFKPQTSVFA